MRYLCVCSHIVSLLKTFLIHKSSPVKGYKKYRGSLWWGGEVKILDFESKKLVVYSLFGNIDPFQRILILMVLTLRFGETNRIYTCLSQFAQRSFDVILLLYQPNFDVDDLSLSKTVADMMGGTFHKLD